MGIDTAAYRARVGCFYDSAVTAQRKLYFLDKELIAPFLCLLSGHISHRLTVSVFIYFVLGKACCTTLSENTPNYKQRGSKTNLYGNIHANDKLANVRSNISHNILTGISPLLFMIITVAVQLHLLLSGDVHLNPGPSSIPNNVLTINHINACSLRDKIDIVSCQIKDCDVVTVSETWFNSTLSNDKTHIAGFHSPVRRDRPTDDHGGVAIYVRDNLICKPRYDLDIPGLEAVWVETKLSQETILICSFYRPPNSRVSYWKLIDESIKNVANTPHKFFILGDFNNDFLKNPSTHLLDILQFNNLSQLVTSPTRFTNTSSTCIDLIITSSKYTVLNTEVRPPICSDHCVPVVKLKNQRKKEKEFKRTIYDYSSLEITKLMEELQRVDWLSIASLPSIDDAAETFSTQLMSVTNICVSHKQITVRERDAPWITQSIKTLIYKKNQIHKRAKSSNSPHDWDTFRKQRNELTDAIRRRKNEYMTNFDNEVSSNDNIGTKKWWKLVKNFMSNKGYTSDEIPPIENNGQIYYSNQEKAKIFNQFFIRQSSIEDNVSDGLPSIPRTDSEITSIELSDQEVEKILHELKPQKAIGPDKVHNKILTASRTIITPALTFLFNRCLREGRFPLIWKTAHVSPIFKKDKKEVCNNYRPISLLSCVGKAFEKCVQQNTFQYLNSNNLITPHQSGFIPGDSTVYHLLNLYHDLCSSLDGNNTVQAIFFDISKAFDRVWHRGLIHKLEAIGIRGSLLNWYIDYLKDRKQAVVIKGEQSDYGEITAGVPQGSVLGPLLFLIYINDIILEIESTIKLFADDTSMYSFIKDLEIQSSTLNSDLSKINEWANKWKVSFNQTKTELMIVSRRHNPNLSPLSFDNTILVPTDSHKHLGVFLQSDCKWDTHIKSIISKCRLLTSCLKSFKYRLSRRALENMYKAYILPHFDFADVLWDNCTQELSHELEMLHLDALRTIIGSVRGTSHEKLYVESGFIPLFERRRRHKIIMYHKIVNKLVPNYLNEILPPLLSEINRYHLRRPLERDHFTWDIERFRTSFFPSTTDIWNNLPEHIQGGDSIGKLKHYLSKDDHFVPEIFFIGNRKAQIIHCKLRLGMSDLSQDMVNRHLTNNATCVCGSQSESARHYLLQCPTYEIVRDNTINKLPLPHQSIETLLNGNLQLHQTENMAIFRAVHEFILETGRF